MGRERENKNNQAVPAQLVMVGRITFSQLDVQEAGLCGGRCVGVSSDALLPQNLLTSFITSQHSDAAACSERIGLY